MVSSEAGGEEGALGEFPPDLNVDDDVIGSVASDASFVELPGHQVVGSLPTNDGLIELNADEIEIRKTEQQAKFWLFVKRHAADRKVWTLTIGVTSVTAGAVLLYRKSLRPKPQQ